MYWLSASGGYEKMRNITVRKAMHIPRFVFELVLLGAFGGCLWLLVCWIAGTREPWDASFYWTLAYPVSVLLACTLGFQMGYRAWIAGAALTLAQFPVMLLLAGANGMSLLGLLLLCVLAIPASILSAVSGWIGIRRARRI